MIKPYYEDSLVKIYNADCLDIIGELPKADILLTDPPYGIDYQSARRIDWQRKEKIVGDNEYPMWLFDYEPNNALFVWCRWDNLYQMPKPKSLIVWDKCRHSMGDLKHEYGRQWEACAFYPYSGHQFVNRPKDIIRELCVTSDKLVHPNEKPVGVMSSLIVNNAGDLVIDPYMGAGSVLLASKLNGRRAIGIEIDERYCEIGAKRCSQQAMDLGF